MKIYGKQVFVGSKKICVDYSYKIIGDISEPIETVEFFGKEIEKDIIFLQDKSGYFIDINDIYGSGFLAMHCYGAVKRFKKFPKHTGDEYIADLKPYFTENLWQEKFDLKDLIESIKASSAISND